MLHAIANALNVNNSAGQGLALVPYITLARLKRATKVIRAREDVALLLTCFLLTAFTYFNSLLFVRPTPAP